MCAFLDLCMLNRIKWGAAEDGGSVTVDGWVCLRVDDLKWPPPLQDYLWAPNGPFAPQDRVSVWRAERLCGEWMPCTSCLLCAIVWRHVRSCEAPVCVWLNQHCWVQEFQFREKKLESQQDMNKYDRRRRFSSYWCVCTRKKEKERQGEGQIRDNLSN